MEAQLLPLVGPGHRDFPIPQGLQRQSDRLAAVHDRRLNVGSQEGEGDQPSQIAVVDADDVTPGCCVGRRRVDPGLCEFRVGAAESRDQSGLAASDPCEWRHRTGPQTTPSGPGPRGRGAGARRPDRPRVARPAS